MICYVLAMGKQHLGPHVVVGYGIKIFWLGLFTTSPDHLVKIVRTGHCCISPAGERVPVINTFVVIVIVIVNVTAIVIIIFKLLLKKPNSTQGGYTAKFLEVLDLKHSIQPLQL